MTHSRFRVFPVRHHSPLAARHLVTEIRERPPKLILIEGPSDASSHVEALAHPHTRPPVALLYFVRGQACSTYPLAGFSPEYQALVTARELNIEARFCDLPYRFEVPGEEAPAPVEPDPEGPEKIERGALDVRWEIDFELASPDLSTYVERAIALGRQASSRSPRDRAREAWMYRAGLDAVAAGLAPEDVLFVCGAAHAPALLDGAVEPEALEGLVDRGEAEIYPVPYSFRRFSSVLGYGAGTAYPHFYQAIWDAGGAVDQAVCRMLTEICHDLQADGFEVSLADTIDAVLFVRSLASLRGKRAPGPEELVAGVESCLTRGHYGRAAEAVARRLVGDRLGCVTPGADKAPLAREFYHFINHPQRSELLPLTDLPAERVLDVNRPRHAEVSRFLHRLVLLGIPYGEPEDPLSLDSRPLRSAPKTLASLTHTQARARETWRLRWTSALDAALADASVHGGTIAEAARAATEERLRSATTLMSLVTVFLSIDRAGLEELVLPALTRVEEVARATIQLVPLVCAANELVTAQRYGAAFASPERTAALAVVLVRRAVQLWAEAPRVPEAEMRNVANALEQLVSVANDLPDPVPRDVAGALARAARSHRLQPEMAGICAAICLRHALLSPVRIVGDLVDRLEAPDAMTHASGFLYGLLGHSRESLLANTEATDALRDFVLRLPEERFVALLPVLRKGFQLSSSSEIRYFMAQLAGDPAAPKKTSPVTRRINRRVERDAARQLERWVTYV